MTIFLNNDGSILITTPILLLVLKYLGLKKHQKTPYLLSGVLIATVSSAPIGVSNIVNLISLKIIGMDLYLHTAMMFVPSMMGLIFMTCLLFMFFYKRLPKSLPDIPAIFSLCGIEGTILFIRHQLLYQNEIKQKSCCLCLHLFFSSG